MGRNEMTKINKAYIAAPWPSKAAAKLARQSLADRGIECTSSWIDFEPEASTEAILQEEAVRDFRDIRRANALILLNTIDLVPLGQGGKHVEVGYALAMNKPVYVIGTRSNVFHYHPGVTFLNSIEELAIENQGV
jgi:hypothetical protein